jgi:hypothetical protein
MHLRRVYFCLAWVGVLWIIAELAWIIFTHRHEQDVACRTYGTSLFSPDKETSQLDTAQDTLAFHGVLVCSLAILTSFLTYLVFNKEGATHRSDMGMLTPFLLVVPIMPALAAIVCYFLNVACYGTLLPQTSLQGGLCLAAWFSVGAGAGALSRLVLLCYRRA